MKLREPTRKVLNDARQASQTNAPWLYPTTTRLRPAVAVLAIIGVYLIGWADGIRGAIWYLADHNHLASTTSWRQTSSGITSYLTNAVALIALILLTTWLLAGRRPFHTVHSRSDLQAEALSASIYLLAFGLAGVAMNGISHLLHHGDSSYPFASSTPMIVLQLVTATLAGPTEELFFCVFLTVVARAGGLRIWHAIALSATLRLIFHLYYGWPSLGLLIWAVAAVIIYTLQGRILGLILIHSAWDLCGASVAHNWTIPATIATLVILAPPVYYIVTSYRRTSNAEVSTLRSE